MIFVCAREGPAPSEEVRELLTDTGPWPEMSLGKTLRIEPDGVEFVDGDPPEGHAKRSKDPKGHDVEVRAEAFRRGLLPPSFHSSPVSPFPVDVPERRRSF